jgi:signal transduction histidine kinase
MKVKLLTVLGIVAVCFIAVVLWKVDGFIYGDRLSWVEAQMRSQSSAINQSVRTELKAAQRVLVTLGAEGFRKDKINWNSLSPYYAVVSFSVSGNQLDPQTVVTKERSPAANWNGEFVRKAVGVMDQKGAGLRYFVKPFQDAAKGRHVALVVVDGAKAYGIFGGGEMFQSLIDAQKGSLSAFSVVTSSGLTVGHSVPEYLGTIMSDDVVFKEAKKTDSSQGAGIFKSSRGQELYGLYEQIPNSNLYVLSSAPLKEAMKGRTGLLWQFLLIGAGLLLVAVAAMLFVIRPEEKQLETMEADLLKAQAAAAKAPVPEKTVVIEQEDMQKEKMQAYMRVASALGHEMRGPLMAILGYSQMILAKTQEPELIENVESIVRETRSSRSILEKLFSFAGEDLGEKKQIKLEGPLAVALKNIEPLLQQKGVKVSKQIDSNSVLGVNLESLTKALENILSNAVEAMERMPKKEISVHLFEDEQGQHLKIKDSGEGIESANLNKIFDPFFTTRSFRNHMGLGLAVALGVIKEHNGSVEVVSERGQGTEVHITFRPQVEVAVRKAPAVPVGPIPVIEEKTQLDIAPELPKLSLVTEEAQEARKEFEENQEKEMKEAPLDLNIDKLLEFPELATPTVAATSVEPQVSSELPSASAFTPPPPPLSAAETLSVREGLEFLEDLNNTVEDAEPLRPAHRVTPPSAPAITKTSRLDEYQVEIRRPGKRT